MSSFDKFDGPSDSMFSDNTPLYTGEKEYKTFERLSHTQTNPDWDGYSFTEKIDPEDQGYGNPEASAARAGWLSGFGAIAAVLGLAALILTWIAYRRCSNGWWLWLLIATIIAFIVGIAVAALGGGIKAAIMNGDTENTFLTGFIFFASAALAVFFFVAGLFVILNKPFRFGCIQCGFPGDGSSWKGFKDDKSLEDGWNNERKVQNWIAFLYLAMALFFMFIAFTVVAISKFLIELSRGILALAGFLVILFGIFALYRNTQAASWNPSIPGTPWVEQDFTILKWLIITTMILAFLTMFFNIAKKRILYFIFGILLLIAAILLVGACAIHLRKLRKVNDPSKVEPITCRNNLIATHEDQVNQNCSSGKYLPAGQTCRKQDATTYWEKDNSAKFLNPAACSSVSSGFFWPVFLTGFFAFLVFGYALIMIGASFFLSDTSEFMEIYNKKVGLPEIIFFVLALLALIVALIFMGKISGNAKSGYQEHPWATKNRQAEEGVFPDDPDYKVVSDNLI